VQGAPIRFFQIMPGQFQVRGWLTGRRSVSRPTTGDRVAQWYVDVDEAVDRTGLVAQSPVERISAALLKPLRVVSRKLRSRATHSFASLPNSQRRLAGCVDARLRHDIFASVYFCSRAIRQETIFGCFFRPCGAIFGREPWQRPSISSSPPTFGRSVPCWRRAWCGCTAARTKIFSVKPRKLLTAKRVHFTCRAIGAWMRTRPDGDRHATPDQSHARNQRSPRDPGI